MSENLSKRPYTVSILSSLIIAYGLYRLVTGSQKSIQTNLPEELWPYTLVALLSALLHSGLALSAGLGILKRLPWAWWLAGIVLCHNLLMSLLSILQLSLMRINDQLLYQLKPEILYSTVAIFIPTLCLFPCIFFKSVKNYTHTNEVTVRKSLAIFIGSAILLLLLIPVFLLIAYQFITLE